MALSPIQCMICGKVFQPTTPNARYCGSDCAAIGMNERRKAWEQKTGYAAKKRDQQRERRAQQRAAALAERAERERIANEARSQREKDHAESRRTAIERAAAAGDPFARMALYSRKSAEFWRAYRDYELQYAAQAGRISTTEVNGIPVVDSDFADAVVRSIQESCQIIERANT